MRTYKIRIYYLFALQHWNHTHPLQTSYWRSSLSVCKWTCAEMWRRESRPACSVRTPCSPPPECSEEDEEAHFQVDPEERAWMFSTSCGWINFIYKIYLVKTHHFEPLHQCAEIRIFLVVLNQSRLNAFPGTLDVHARTVHLCQIHSLQVPQTPEQHLRCIFNEAQTFKATQQSIKKSC